MAKKYGVPMPHGVPALVVVGKDGKVVYAQNKEFSNMRNLQSSDLTTFLERSVEAAEAMTGQAAMERVVIAPARRAVGFGRLLRRTFFVGG